MKPRDARTPGAVIAFTLLRENKDQAKILDLTRKITDELAHWLLMKAGSFEPFDERTPGYEELAQDLLGR